MPSPSLQLICDGEVEIIRITEDLYEETAEFFLNYYMKYENFSIACNLCENPETVAEMQVLLKAMLKDNISFAARDVKTQELVAICINKLWNPSAQITLDEVFGTFKSPNMLTLRDYVHIIEGDIFKEWQIDCAIDLSYLCTRPDYAKRGIALAVAKHVLEYAAKLKEGNCEDLPDQLRGQKPKAIYSVFTSPFSQSVGEKLGFEILSKEENANFTFEGKTFAEKIDPSHKYTIFAAKRL